VQQGERFLAFTAPIAILEARDLGSVLSMLREADAALAAGRFVAGFVAYEAAAAFGLATRPPDPEGPPLVWLGVFDAPSEAPWPSAPTGPPPELTWRPALDATSHAARLAQALRADRRGATATR
jgi:para-aminobenzoate synthetase/4-amino-4-deoxychorismate lyase